MKNSLWAVILAGGKGTRFGTLKQMVKLKGKPVLEYSLGNFESHPEVQGIVLVVAGEIFSWAEKLRERHRKIKKIVEGGRNRQESSRAGVLALEGEGIVLIHDAARPNFSKDLIDRVAEGAKKWGAAVPIIPVTDTIARVGEGFLKEFLPREGVFRVQTPQGFRISLIKEAHLRIKEGNFPDDSSLFIASGVGKVRAVEGEETNIKITYPSDLKVLEQII